MSTRRRDGRGIKYAIFLRLRKFGKNPGASNCADFEVELLYGWVICVGLEVANNGQKKDENEKKNDD